MYLPVAEIQKQCMLNTCTLALQPYRLMEHTWSDQKRSWSVRHMEDFLCLFASCLCFEFANCLKSLLQFVFSITGNLIGSWIRLAFWDQIGGHVWRSRRVSFGKSVWHLEKNDFHHSLFSLWPQGPEEKGHHYPCAPRWKSNTSFPLWFCQSIVLRCAYRFSSSIKWITVAGLQRLCSALGPTSSFCAPL